MALLSGNDPTFCDNLHARVEPRCVSGDVEDVLIRTLGKPKAYNDKL